MKVIAVLGSTGSIGTQTLEIVRQNQDIQVVGLSAGGNLVLLEEQIREFRPRLASVWLEEDAIELRQRTKDLNIEILSGMDGLIEIAAIKAHKDIALANKETLVTAGHLIMPLAKEKNVKIYPVDSEHSAIFQSLNGENPKEIEKIIITASGGPFRGKRKEELLHVKAEDALKHPNWSMGRKITIDSATLINKGLEVIEAKWLFDVTLDQIEVVVQPQSIIHSMVQFVDGGIIAQLGTPDMKLPIQYALYYPERKHLGGKRVDFFELSKITFEKPDTHTFRGLELAYRAISEGGSMPTILNAANERAVALFLDNKIKFLEIAEVIEEAMDAHQRIEKPSVAQILEAEQEAYELIASRYPSVV